MKTYPPVNLYTQTTMNKISQNFLGLLITIAVAVIPSWGADSPLPGTAASESKPAPSQLNALTFKVDSPAASSPSDWKKRVRARSPARAPTLSVADRFWGLKYYFGLWPVGLGRLINGASGFFWCLRVGFPALARLGRPQFGVEAMKTLKVVGQAHQLPFEGYFFQSAH